MYVNIECMQKGFDDFKYLLVATCEISNFVLAIPIKTSALQVVAETNIHRVICIFVTQKLLMVEKILH